MRFEMFRTTSALAGLLVLVLFCVATPAFAWERGAAPIFAILPEGAPGPEGITVGPDGNVYVATFGFVSNTGVSGPGQLFTFSPEGKLLRRVSVEGASPNLLGIAFHPLTHALLVLDCAANDMSVTPKVLSVNPLTGESSVFMTLSMVTARPCPNGITFDQSKNVYISDSFQGIIWKTGPAGGVATPWASDATLLTPAPKVGVPPFGANGIEFNREYTAMFVANTANDTLIKVTVNPDGSAGAITTFVNSINGADGIAIDSADNIWVAANQEDEIVVVNPAGKVIAKLGDFRGIDRHGIPHGLLFPASLAFSKDGPFLYVTNLALNLNIFGLPTIDSAWCAEVKRYTVSKIRIKIPPIQRRDLDDE